MTPQGPVSAKQGAGCLAVIAVVLLGVTYLSVGSLNVLSVYGASGPLWAKITVSLLGAMLATGLLQLVSQSLGRKVISTYAGMPADDVRCPGCEQPLLKFAAAYGRPVRCPSCKKWWHFSICYRKGGEHTRVLAVCPECRGKATDDNRDLFPSDGASW